MPLLAARAVSKSYGGVRALTDVDLVVNPGEVLGLVGENGSGKSSLLKILGGRMLPDAGSVVVAGSAVLLRSPREALRHGVALVAQEVVVHRDLTVAENLFVGSLPRRWGLVDRAALARQASTILRGLDVDIDPGARLGALSLQYQQIVGIAKMVARRPRVLLLDEPTSSLGGRDVATMHRTVRRLAAEGVGVVYITHRMEEYFALTDRLIVLRDGRVVVSHVTGAVDERQVVADMVGRDLGHYRRARRPGLPATDPPALQVRELSAAPGLHAITLRVAAGEIVGLAGQAGSGRSRLLRTLFGAGRPGGDILVGGRRLRRRGVRAAMLAGLGLVPEDRKRSGLMLRMSVRENLTVTSWHRLQRFGFVRRAAEAALVAELVRSLQLRGAGADAPVATLSGGNQQKVVLGKWLAVAPRVLLLDEPTRGVDVGAKAEIYELVERLAAGGTGVLLASSDLPELLRVCDRIVVMAKGRVVGEQDGAQASEQSLTALAFQAAAA